MSTNMFGEDLPKFFQFGILFDAKVATSNVDDTVYCTFLTSLECMLKYAFAKVFHLGQHWSEAISAYAGLAIDEQRYFEERWKSTSA